MFEGVPLLQENLLVDLFLLDGYLFFNYGDHLVEVFVVGDDFCVYLCAFLQYLLEFVLIPVRYAIAGIDGPI